VVCSASYEARKFGVHSAMPTAQAAKLCPQAIFVWSGPSEYHKYSRLVTDIILSKVPVVEKASIDEFYLDLTGMDRFFPVFPYLLSLKQQVRDETGLPISFALASNKLISKIATNEAKPNGEIEIPAGSEQAYLAPMPVGKIPGCGEKTVDLLRQKGIERIEQLTAAGPAQLERWLGKWGLDLYRKSLGQDDSPVTPYHEQKSISSEETFGEDTDDAAYLEKEITRLCEKVGYELRQEGKLAGCVTIKLRYENFETLTRQQVIDHSQSDLVFIRKAKELFRQAYDPRRKVRLLGVRLSQLDTDVLQMNLFENPEEDKNLFSAIDQIKQQFGKQALFRAGSQQLRGDAQKKTDDPLWINRNAKPRE
jgi:DNA polymerase-4